MSLDQHHVGFSLNLSFICTSKSNTNPKPQQTPCPFSDTSLMTLTHQTTMSPCVRENAGGSTTWLRVLLKTKCLWTAEWNSVSSREADFPGKYDKTLLTCWSQVWRPESPLLPISTYFLIAWYTLQEFSPSKNWSCLTSKASQAGVHFLVLLPWGNDCL